MIYTLSDIYLDYLKTGGTVGKSTFKNVVSDFNIHSMNEIIFNARVLNMKCGLSSINIMQLKRNFNNPVVDWYESNKYKQELINAGKELYDEEAGKGEKWLVYFTDDKYCRFYWAKKFVKLKNKMVYRFEPTRGLKGNKEKLIQHLKENELNILKYKHGSF
jgi:hypothetical protein